MGIKTIISIVSVVLVFVGYYPYILDILKRKTTPHTFTFLVWSIASSITWGLQVKGGAGVGAWITFTVAAICIFIFFLSFKYGEKNITTFDVVFLILALLSFLLWPIFDQPFYSLLLTVTTDVLGFAPTIRKSWNKPRSETLFTWEMSVFRHGLSIFALEKFNIFTLLYPVAWTAANLIFCIILVIRRKQVKQDLL